MPDQISPAQWDARVDYDSKHWTPWNPDKWVIHYVGGRTTAAVAPFSIEKEMAKLRQMEDWHIDGQGWLGLAYNYGIGQTGTLYRIRGEQRSGATSGDEDEDGIPENHEARAVVFILGGDQEPTQAALDTFSAFWATDPKRVIGHRDSTDTPCPGDHLYAWIQAKGYEDMVDRNTAVDPNPDLADNVEKMREAGVFSEHTQPGGVTFNDELATFLVRAGLRPKKGARTWTRAEIAAIAAGSAVAGASADEVIAQIARILGGG